MDELTLFRILYIISCGIAYASGGFFILTAPKELDAGSSESIFLSVFDTPTAGPVTVKLLKKHSDEIISQTTIFSLNNQDVWGKLEVPDVKDTEGRLHVESNFNSSTRYKINAVKEIRIRHKSFLTFIQTDKPIYKPGQVVKFRILSLDHELLPLDNETNADVWIKDPSDIRVAQWKNIGLSSGIIQLELPLSEDPVLGSWSVHCSVKDITNSQTFRVDEYVLPKFDVVIIPPSYVMADASEIQIKICAQYTYGKKVDGLLRSKVTYKLKHSKPQNKQLPFVKHDGPISGCTDFVVQTKDLSMHYFHDRVIEIFAEVVENSTEIKRNSTAHLEISHSPLQMEFLGADENSQYFKSGLPYYGELSIRKPDGAAAISERIKICAKSDPPPSTELCDTFESDEEGKVNFIVPPLTSTVERIILEAESIREEKMNADLYSTKIFQPNSKVNLKAWYSPSNSHLQIESINDKVKCGKQQLVKIRYTANIGAEIDVHFQVISRGRIVDGGIYPVTFLSSQLRMLDLEDPRLLRSSDLQLLQATTSENQSQQFNYSTLTGNREVFREFEFNFYVKATMAPVARLLIFYVKGPGEVVADTRVFYVSGCLPNQANLTFLHTQQYPNTEAAMVLSASPNSLCGIGLIDKSIDLLYKKEQFSKKKVFKRMRSFDIDKDSLPKQRTENYCERKGNDFMRRRPWQPNEMRQRFGRSVWTGRHEDIWFQPPSAYVDSITAFEDAGVIVITDFSLENRPCPDPVIHQRPLYYDPHFSFNGDLIRPRGPGMPGMSAARVKTHRPSTSEVRPENSLSSPLKPLKPLKPVKKKPAKAELEIRSYFPETWLWEIHNISSNGELILKRELPHTITEWTGKAVCVHPVTGLGISDDSSITAFQPFFISFSLPYSIVRGEVLTVVISVFNYLSECLPIKLSLEASKSFKIMEESAKSKLCVCGQRSESWRFRIRPVDLGNINITAYAYSLQEDVICENEITANLTARDAVTRQLLVEAEGFPREETHNIYFCPEKTNSSFTTEVDLILPENAVPDSARGFMYVTGDLIGPALSGLESLVRLPVGCGEQNMVLFTPNIYVLDYLTATGKLTDEIEEKIINYLKTGYQRELRYRHEDGSYSAFGKSDKEGNLWLTAFVIKSFAQARRFISIDETDLSVSTSWIVNQQQDNGCFPVVGKLFHKALKGGLDKDHQSLAPLTAFVLISLLESHYKINDTVNKALACLEGEKYPSTYSLALIAYAMALSENPNSEDYINHLESLAIKKGSFTYWDYEGHNSQAINVEIAGYAVLAMLETGGTAFLNRVRPIVSWITQQRNSNGGFVSTQDTVVALQALAKYGSYITASELNIRIKIESDQLVQHFEIKNDNKLLMQMVKLPAVPTVVDFHATGHGCAIAQFSVKYNVKDEPKGDIFDLQVVASQSVEHPDCNTHVVKICMRYNDPNQETNMLIVDVKLVSGYVPDKLEIEKLHNNVQLGIKRHEFKEDKVLFYFSELTNSQKCFEFYLKKEIDVESTTAAPVKIYDYYQPELQAVTSYSIPSECVVEVIEEN